MTDVITVRAIERDGKPPVLTMVDDTPERHGPGEFIVMVRQGDDGYVEQSRFGDTP